MDLNPSDRLALRNALEKLSASASAMASASDDIKNLVARLEPQETSLVDATAAPTSAPQSQAEPEFGPLIYEMSSATGPLTLHGRSNQIPRFARHRALDPESEGWPLGVDKQRAQAPAYPRPVRPARPAKPPLTSEEKIMRGVAIGGGVITVAGVILLVSVAIQRGWLGPLGRVIGAYLLAILLIGAAYYVQKRGTRTEALVALTVTSQIAFLATTSAVIFILDWWPAGIGSFVALIGNIAFLMVGRMWSLSKLEKAAAQGHAVYVGAIAVSGVSSLMFAATYDSWWPIFSILAALILSYRISTDIIRGGIALIAVILQFILVNTWLGEQWPAAILGSATALLLVAFTLWDPLKITATNKEDIALEEYWRSFETNPISTWVGTVAPVIIVVFTSATYIHLGWQWFALIPACGVALLGILALHSADSAAGESQRIARLTSVVGLALTAGTFVQLFYGLLPTNPLFVMVFLIAGAGLFMWLHTLPAERHLGVVPWVAWLLAAVAMTGVLLRNVVTVSPLWLTDTSALIQALLILVFIAATVYVRRGFYGHKLRLQILVGLTLLTLSAISIVTITTFIGHLIAGNAGMMLGFLIGHATVSILWMVIAAALMLNRKLLDAPGALWTGVGLAVAGTIKLVFFDLVALSGVPRAIAFLLSGIALLTIAAMRGRRTAENKSSTTTDTKADTPTGAL
ncbi:hypothetical protein N24_1469 [Corynebacterium suranareeae]|uniref:DUF2339 domain-containing protein n=1 Tax=Corynebacterium suranareeae TaxID=2506452 RepID=A0A160PS61_9CORY|nr:DUF2339 domain-containing protein [Corynebacterium suranareeae]BAU95731.1 hypothetical protein N24_1469 [Corynebacterium suranareeae]